MSKFTTYLEETKTELLTKVSWPTWSELQGSAIVVMVSSVIIALVVFAMDFGFDKLMELAYGAIRSL
jgi:preprotein translocase subunit SecE